MGGRKRKEKGKKKGRKRKKKEEKGRKREEKGRKREEKGRKRKKKEEKGMKRDKKEEKVMEKKFFKMNGTIYITNNLLISDTYDKKVVDYLLYIVEWVSPLFLIFLLLTESFFNFL